MIGRERERAELHQALDLLAAGRCAPAILVEGMAGIGKTALLDDAAGYTGIPFRKAAAYELEAGRPFGVVVDLLHRASPPGAAAAPPGLTSAEARFAVADALVEQLAASADGQPMIVMIDDLQWCDVGSTMVLDRLVRHRDRFGIGIVAATRTGLAPHALVRSMRNGGTVIRLRELDPPDATALVCDRVGAVRLGPVLNDLTDAAGGHPLSLVAMTEHLRGNGAVTVRAGRAEATVDRVPALAETLLTGLPALDGPAREVLRAAAVLGARCSLAEIVDLTDRSAAAVTTDVEALLATGHLRQTAAGLELRHDLLRRALLDALPPGAVEELHRDAAWRLHRTGADPLRVTAHLRRGARRGERPAIDLLTEAAAVVAAQDPAEAVALLERACDLEHDQGRRDALEVRSLWPLVWSARAGDAALRAEALLRRNLDAASAVEVRIAAAAAAHVLGRREEVLRHTEVDGAITAAPSDRLLQLRAEGADAFVLLRDLEEGEAGAVALAHEAEAAEMWPAATLAWGAAAQARAMRGWFPDAVEHAQRAVRCGDRTNEARRRNKRHLLGVLLHHCDRSAEGAEVLEEGLRENERLGVVWSTATHHLFLAGVCLDTGRLDDADLHLEAAVAAAEDTDERLNRTDARLLQAMCATHRGDLTSAERLLSAREGAPSTPVAQATARLTYLDALGDDDALREDLLRFEPPRGSIGWARGFGPPVVRMFLFCGLKERAQAVLPVLETVAARAGTASAEASRLRVAGMVTNDPDPILRAAELLRTTARVAEVGDACEEAADLLPLRDPARVTLLRESHDAAATTGRVVALRRRAEKLRRLGITPPASAPNPSAKGWSSLTPAERRVVDLVAEGLTYRAVADRLHLSRRTVETHVAHAFQKLGLRSREELAQVATRRRS